jgi:hypothetical protein
MKRFILAGLIVLMLILPAWSQSWEMPSTTKTASAAILSMRGNFHGLFLVTDGTNAVTVDVYDNTAASGRKLIPTWVVPSSATNRSAAISFNPPIPVKIGIYVNVSVAGGGSVSYMAYYSN